MTKEIRAINYENRYNKLSQNGKANSKICAKLLRRLRNLNK